MTDVSIEASKAHSGAAHHKSHAAQRLDNYKFAMWLFLASEVVLFTVMIAAFVVWRLTGDNNKLVHEVHEQTGVLLVTFNTFLLLASSFSMVMGLREMQKGNRPGLIRWIGATALLGVIFVALQGVEYTILSSEGVTIYGSEFGMRFYAPTALHGAHVIIGVIWALAVIIAARRGSYSSRDTMGVELFGLYWHFVDVVWIIIFTVIYLL
jgi:heme/copper-type cytochrome/quinol oxidase subunit 3